jgi:GTP-binding protein
MPFDKKALFGPEIEAQIGTALAEAALVWVIADAAEGVNPYDAELARRVQTSGRPWVLIANKAEGPERLGRLGDFYRLGAPAVLGVSALQGFGVEEALAASALRAPELRADAGEAPGESTAIRVTFVGRPNVGKSSLVNAILGEPRFIVSEVPGTTREAVDAEVTVEGERFLLVDTAGLRRRARTTEHLDKLSAVNTLQALDRAEVAVLVLDASEGTVDQDARIAGHILERNRACVVALNKWDLVAGESLHRTSDGREASRQPHEVQADIEHALRFISLAEPVRVSALGKTGLRHLFRAIRTAHRQYTRMIVTADLNRVLQIVTRQTPPPARGRSPTKVHYGVQTRTRPPEFRLFTNHPEQVREEYTRFMERQLRYHFGLAGTPLRIVWSGRESSEPETRAQTRKARQPKERVRRGNSAGPKRKPAGRGPPGNRSGRRPDRPKARP